MLNRFGNRPTETRVVAATAEASRRLHQPRVFATRYRATNFCRVIGAEPSQSFAEMSVTNFNPSAQRHQIRSRNESVSRKCEQRTRDLRRAAHWRLSPNDR
jgi:hypothetical protein